MRIMAREAGQGAIAVAETCGAVQIRWLMAHVPGIAPVGIVVQLAGLAMARATEGIDLDGRQPFGILNRRRARRLGVRAAGPVARLAANTLFGGLDLVVGRKCYRSGR